MAHPQLLFYYAAGSNSSDRVHWVLDYKEATCQRVAEADVPTEVRQIFNPFGRVPSLMVGQRTLTEPMAICEYLDEIYPEPPLLPGDSLNRALIREICEFVGATVHPGQSGTTMRFYSAGQDTEARLRIRQDWFQLTLPKLRTLLFRESGYAAGTVFSLADAFVASIFGRAVALGLHPSDWPDFTAHFKLLMQQQSVRASCPISADICDRILQA